MVYITMRETREERKQKLSQKASRAVQVRWDREHVTMREAGITPIYDQPHAYGDYKITIESMRSGKVNVLYLRGEDSTLTTSKKSRRDNFLAELNGQPFKPERVSISTVTRIVRKSIVKTKSGRVI